MPFDLFSLPKEKRDVLEQLYFNPNVDKRGPNECWEWKASGRSGYGIFVKRFGKERLNINAHRLAWMFRHNVPVPPGLLCCHSCDNRPCCNPDHIFIGTDKHNQEDRQKKEKLGLLIRKNKKVVKNAKSKS